MTPKRIGFIGFDGVVAIDLAGPAEAFACAQIKEGENGPKPCYEVLTIASSNQLFAAESGVVFKPQKNIQKRTAFGHAHRPRGKRPAQAKC